MGERPDDQVTPRVPTSSTTASDMSMSGAETNEESTETIKAEIEQTRSSMSDTIEAIQDRLSPSRALDRAKDSVLEATVGRVKSAANLAGSSAGDVAGHTRDAAAVAIERVRENPLPFALLGVGLAWMALRSRSSGKTSRSDEETDYAWTEPQWQAETEYGSSRDQRSREQSVWNVITENPIPMAVTAISIGWLVKNLRAESDVDDWTYSDADDYSGSSAYAGPSGYGGSGAYGSSATFGGGSALSEGSVPRYDSAYTGSGAFDSPGTGYSAGAYTGTSSVGGAEGAASSTVRRSQELASQASGAVRDAAKRGGERVSEIASQASDVASQAGETVRDAAQRGGERLGVVASQASEAARRGGERLGAIASQASDAARVAARRSSERVTDLARRGREGVGEMASRTQNQVDRMMEENPLALGLAALAVGAVVGLSIPSTEVENQYLGETRDQLLDRAKGLAQQTAKQVTSSAEQFAQNVKEQVATAQETPPA